MNRRPLPIADLRTAAAMELPSEDDTSERAEVTRAVILRARQLLDQVPNRAARRAQARAR